jgi:hypothetical protein
VAVHLDLDGLYSGAKWVRDGIEPYEGADADARAVDTRQGTPGPIAERIDRALRARFRDESLKHLVVQFLVAGADRRRSTLHWEEIEHAAREIDPLLDESRRLAAGYQIRDGVAYLDVGGVRGYDKTELLLLGQERAPAAVIRDSGSLTIAADFASGLDFVKMMLTPALDVGLTRFGGVGPAEADGHRVGYHRRVAGRDRRIRRLVPREQELGGASRVAIAFQRSFADIE